MGVVLWLCIVELWYSDEVTINLQPGTFAVSSHVLVFLSLSISILIIFSNLYLIFIHQEDTGYW